MPAHLEAYNKEIAEKVKSGDYYKEAWDWYTLKYVYPVTQRTLLIFITVASVLITLMGIYVFLSYLPIKVQVPLAIQYRSMTEDYARLFPLPVAEDEDPNLPVIKYLVENYVTSWENYEFRRLDRQKTVLMRFSSPALQAEIEKRYDIRNLSSPVLKFRDHTTRSITITNYALEKSEAFAVENSKEADILAMNIPYRAVISFESEERNILGATTKKWMAEVGFTMSPIYYDKEKDSFRPLDFVVTSYRVVPQ